MDSSEQKRSFDLKRLYKLTKITVILITSLSILVAYLSFKNMAFFNELAFKGAEYCSNLYSVSQRNSMTDAEWKKASTEIDNCYKEHPGIQSQKQNEIDFKYSSLLAIFLPIFFLGSIGLYRYLFPMK